MQYNTFFLSFLIFHSLYSSNCAWCCKNFTHPRLKIFAHDQRERKYREKKLNPLINSTRTMSAIDSIRRQNVCVCVWRVNEQRNRCGKYRKKYSLSNELCSANEKPLLFQMDATTATTTKTSMNYCLCLRWVFCMRVDCVPIYNHILCSLYCSQINFLGFCFK